VEASELAVLFWNGEAVEIRVISDSLRRERERMNKSLDRKMRNTLTWKSPPMSKTSILTPASRSACSRDA
jgi:hypothetical protein